MTVCIAARSQGHAVLMADQMITSGDIQCEVNDAKMHRVSESIHVMYSGDAGFFGEVIQEVLHEVEKREEDGENILVAHVARIWAKQFTEARYRHAETHVLFPYGLNRKLFVEKLATLDQAFASRIAGELASFKVPSVDVIIVGIDEWAGRYKPSIWQGMDNEIVCADELGFAAIGSGHRHAESAIMTSGYTWETALPDAILAIYMAKRNAELAPGVGKQFDGIIMGEDRSAHGEISNALKDVLDREYQRILSISNGAKAEARQAINSLLEESDAKESKVEDPKKLADKRNS